MARQDAASSPTSKSNASWPHELKPNKTIGIVDVPQEAVQEATDGVEASEASADDVADEAVTATVVPTLTTQHATGHRTSHDWTTTILTINGKDHLKGLKRTGGGVGSSRHDASQKGIESFFKRRKID